jgi:hypothetical protein
MIRMRAVALLALVVAAGYAEVRLSPIADFTFLKDVSRSPQVHTQ